MCLVYHPPRAATAQLLISHVIDTADALRVRYPAAKLVICGDFNRLDISDIVHQLDLTQVVDFPTHQQATLDLIITDLSQQYLSPRSLPPMGRSTHRAILWTPTPTTSRPRSAVTTTHRPMPDSAMREFGQWVTQHQWTEVLEEEDVHTKWQNYVSTTTEAFHHYFPAKSVTVHHPSDAPWMTPKIKRLMRQRNWAYHSCPVQYRKVRNRVIREIKTAKANYYPDKLHRLKLANNRQWFSKIKALCGLQKQASSFPCTSHLPANLAAEEINGHFSSICQTFPPLHTTSLPAYLPAPSPPPTVQDVDVFKRILKFKPRSTTPTDLPIKIYKEFAAELAIPTHT